MLYSAGTTTVVEFGLFIVSDLSQPTCTALRAAYACSAYTAAVHSVETVNRKHLYEDAHGGCSTACCSCVSGTPERFSV
jgi:hypothetical protein